MENENNNLVTLALFRFVHRANMVQALLNDAGIKSVVYSSSMFKQIDTVKLQVHQKDLEKARKVLRDNKAEFGSDEFEAL
ncbi:MAG: putative signal transducing protein [Bacteroidota bacterium]